MNRFTLTNTSVAGQWRCCDFETQISCVFEKHKFNETQIFDVSEANTLNADELARAANNMSEWLRDNHYNIIMPPVDEKIIVRVRIGKRIAELREERGLNQQELAGMCGLTKSTISNIENARFGVGIDILNKIVAALGCKIDFVEI